MKFVEINIGKIITCRFLPVLLVVLKDMSQDPNKILKK